MSKMIGVNLIEAMCDNYPDRFADEPAPVPEPEPEDPSSKGETPPTDRSTQAISTYIQAAGRKRKGDKAPKISTTTVFEKLSTKIKESRAQQARYFHSIKDTDPLTAQKQVFGELIARSAHNLEKKQWANFQLELHQSLVKHCRQTKERRTQQQQRRPQPLGALGNPPKCSMCRQCPVCSRISKSTIGVAERQCPNGHLSGHNNSTSHNSPRSHCQHRYLLAYCFISLGQYTDV